MAHFARIDETNIVQEVIVISNSDINDLPFPESESIGQDFIASVGLEGTWLQTSYNHNFRGTYAGIGYYYDSALNVFQPPVTVSFEGTGSI
jgi:hypothetical protein